MHHKSARSGFTLVELLVVIAIIGVLVSLLQPAVQAAREAARRCQCQNNLKQFGLAMLLHHDSMRRFPMGRNGMDQYSVSWAYEFLPFIEQNAMYSTYVKSARNDDPVNSRTMRTPLSLFACPSRRGCAADRNFDNCDSPPLVMAAGALGDYAGNAGSRYDTGMLITEIPDFDQITGGYDPSTAGPLFSGSKIADRNIIDGLSNTIALGERHIPPVPVGTPPNMAHYFQGDTAFLSGDQPRTILAGAAAGIAGDLKDPGLSRFGSSHPAICLFLYLDGHVTSISNSIDYKDLVALCSIGGGEVIKQDE